MGSEDKKKPTSDMLSKSFRKRHVILAWINAIIPVMAVFAILVGIYSASKDRPIISYSEHEMEGIKVQLKALSARIDGFSGILNLTVKAYNKAMEDPNKYANISILYDIESVSSELKSLKDALGSDVERTLSVPLLRKDVEKIQEQLEERTATASREIDRIYDQNKWFIGLMGTMAVGLLGLAISNLLQTRKKEAAPETTD